MNSIYHVEFFFYWSVIWYLLSIIHQRNCLIYCMASRWHTVVEFVLCFRLKNNIDDRDGTVSYSKYIWSSFKITLMNISFISVFCCSWPAVPTDSIWNQLRWSCPHFTIKDREIITGDFHIGCRRATGTIIVLQVLLMFRT